jgi:demethylmenaquinone methyltransferase/2-methoxy-6-polyprenyl-1,4-benzoquinol methylase
MTDVQTASPAGSPLGSRGNESSTAAAVRDMFTAVAPRYDLLNHFLSFGRDIAWRRATAKALQEVLARPQSTAVDLCCGTGDMTLALARRSAGMVIGTDFCAPMLALAHRKTLRARCVAAFLEADTLALPFRDDSLDAATIAFGFRNLADYSRGVVEMRRVLKVGAQLAILEFSEVCWPVFGPLFRFYFRRILPWLGTAISGVAGPYQYLHRSVTLFPNQESLARTLRESGFDNVRYVNLTGGVAALHLGTKA